MVFAGCHVGSGIICLDERNASAACNKDHKKCIWAKYPDITYTFRSCEIADGWGVDIPSNAIGINTDKNHVSWLEPTRRKSGKVGGSEKSEKCEKCEKK